MRYPTRSKKAEQLLKDAEDEHDPIQRRAKRRLWLAYCTKLIRSWKHGYRTPLLLMFFAVVAHAGEMQDKTHRMSAIEKKFGLTMAFVLKGDDGVKRWVFITPCMTITKMFPVIVPVNATDSQVDVAQHAAQFCNECDGELFKRYLESHHPDTVPNQFQ